MSRLIGNFVVTNARGRPQAAVVPFSRVGRPVPPPPVSVPPIKVEMRADVLGPPAPPSLDAQGRIKVLDLMRYVSRVTGVDTVDIVGPSRKATYVKARTIIMFVASRFARSSLNGLGQKLNRDHSTVIYGRDRVQAIVDEIGAPLADTPQSWVAHLWIASWPPSGRDVAKPAGIC